MNHTTTEPDALLVREITSTAAYLTANRAAKTHIVDAAMDAHDISPDEPRANSIRAIVASRIEAALSPLRETDESPAADDERQAAEAAQRLTMMLAKLDRYATDHVICRCGREQNVLGEILAVSVDCEIGHGDPIGAGDATGQDLRAVLDRLRRLERERANDWTRNQEECPSCLLSRVEGEDENSCPRHGIAALAARDGREARDA